MKDFFYGDLYARDYRRKADEMVKPFSNKLIIIYLVYFAIMLVIGVIDSLTGTTEIQQMVIDGVTYEYTVKSTWFQGLVSLVITGPLTYSFIMIAAKVYKNETPEVQDLGSGFKRFEQSFLVYLLSNIFTALWLLLFIIPGIIKAYSYVMAPFIGVDNPHLSANECITKSKEMMKGNKWKYFCMEFSYIGWMLLSVLTLGILLLWVIPKMQQASYLFYLKVSGKGLDDIQAQDALEAEENNQIYSEF